MNTLAGRQAGLRVLGNIDQVFDGLDKDHPFMTGYGAGTLDLALVLAFDTQVAWHWHNVYSGVNQ